MQIKMSRITLIIHELPQNGKQSGYINFLHTFPKHIKICMRTGRLLSYNLDCLKSILKHGGDFGPDLDNYNTIIFIDVSIVYSSTVTDYVPILCGQIQTIVQIFLAIFQILSPYRRLLIRMAIPRFTK